MLKRFLPFEVANDGKKWYICTEIRPYATRVAVIALITN